MKPSSVHQLSERFTELSDRFRSLWTFYQFLGGVYKHRGAGEVPYQYDFQALYRRLQELVPRVGMEGSSAAALEFEHMERELGRIHAELSKIERGFQPSLLRRFFDHLKRQDEKILYALVKFYMRSADFDQDTLDKLDILLTRLAETPLQEGRYAIRNPSELRKSFDRLAVFGGVPDLPAAEATPLIEAVRELRSELRSIASFEQLVDSEVYDRYRKLKQRIGRSFLYPPLLVEVISTNIDAKNLFQRLYRDEELKILEETNRVFEIERYLERNPDISHEELERQIREFREWWARFDAGRRDDNIKREDILELRRAMMSVITEFEPLKQAPQPTAPPATDPGFESVNALSVDVPTDVIEGEPFPDLAPPAAVAGDKPEEGATLAEVMPADSLLNEAYHKIMFALELVVWDRSPNQVVHAPELVELQLEPWEVESYRRLVEQTVRHGTTAWELEVFFLRSAALRIKMDEERRQISELAPTENDERVFELLERAAQSLERAREVDHRFQWFIDDLLYGGETEKLEHLYRSRFRFLHSYSGLWLDHQARGGLTPL
jgi:hypothetical protein